MSSPIDPVAVRVELVDDPEDDDPAELRVVERFAVGTADVAGLREAYRELYGGAVEVAQDDERGETVVEATTQDGARELGAVIAASLVDRAGGAEQLAEALGVEQPRGYH